MSMSDNGMRAKEADMEFLLGKKKLNNYSYIQT